MFDAIIGLLGAILGLLVYGILIVVIFGGLLLLAMAFKMTVDDPAIGQKSDIPEVDSMAKEGWILIYTAEDNDYFMLAQVYESDSVQDYRAILSTTSNPPTIQSDGEYESLDQAKMAANDWAYTYTRDED